MSDIDTIMNKIDGIEASIQAFDEKAKGEFEAAGSVAAETKAQIEQIGLKQLELAEELLEVQQRGGATGEGSSVKTLGQQFAESDSYNAYIGGQSSKCRMEITNATLLGGDATVAPDRKAAIAPGDFHFLTLEGLFPHVPTSSNAIEYTKELLFTNSAAEAAEGAEKGESVNTFELKAMPVSTVAHWLRISKQLASDNVALAAYVNSRMIYGVNRRVETQLGAGDGIAPNISGILDSGNFTAHGYAAAALGTLKKWVLIRKIIADLWAAGGQADAILLNPADFATIEIDMFDVATNNMQRMSTDAAGNARIFGIPVVQSNGITADNIAIGDFGQSGTIYDRESVIVEMSDSDDDNFTKNMITIRAERRLALTIERPTMIIAGDLTPA
jgi:HK97 family phage major capsid protein